MWLLFFSGREREINVKGVWVCAFGFQFLFQFIQKVDVVFPLVNVRRIHLVVSCHLKHNIVESAHIGQRGLSGSIESKREYCPFVWLKAPRD